MLTHGQTVRGQFSPGYTAMTVVVSTRHLEEGRVDA
jgi:hypothetical protein